MADFLSLTKKDRFGIYQKNRQQNQDENVEEDGHSLEENPSKIHSVQKDASNEETEIKYSIPIVTVTGNEAIR